MEPSGPEQNEQALDETNKDSVFVSMRAPVFSYLANGLSQPYKQEFADLQRDGSFKRIQEFHQSPFGVLMGQILDTATAQQEMELPKVSLRISDEQMKVMNEKMVTPSDAAGRLLYRQMMGELSDEYKAAKMSKRISDAKKKMKSWFGK